MTEATSSVAPRLTRPFSRYALRLPLADKVDAWFSKAVACRREARGNVCRVSPIAGKPAPTAERIKCLMAFPHYRPPGGGCRAIFVLLNI